MRKAAHPSGGMDSSNPHRWRGEQLHHHGDGVCLLFVLFCAVSSDRRHSSYVDKYESNLLKVGLLMKQSVPPRLAPYASSSTATTTITSPSSSSPPAPANKKRKLNEGASNIDVSSNDDYPHLLRALGKEENGFNPADPTIQKIMRGLLAELIDLLSKDYELNIIDSANNSVSYVHVPRQKTLQTTMPPSLSTSHQPPLPMPRQKKIN